jgi:hypothetical protein
MKKIFITIIASSMFGAVYAQQPTQDPYPNAPAIATDIIKYNFYIDSIRSVNEQTETFLLPVSTNTNTLQAINITGTLSGVHQLYAKVTTTDGKPSIFNVGTFYMEGDNKYQNAPAPATEIIKYNFYIDSIRSVNEQTETFLLPVATNSNPLQAINITGTASGVHQLYAKVTTSDGKPSIFNVGTFYMEGDNKYQNAPAPATDIIKYNFYIDSIRSVNEQTETFLLPVATNSNPLQAINITGTASGVHQLYAKVTATDGKPSIFNVGTFYMEGDNKYQNVPAAAVNINRYEFYIDSVGSSNIQSLGFGNNTINSTPAQNIDLTGVLPGSHQLYARVFDENNKPSIVNFGGFLMEQIYRYQNTPTAAPTVANMEYFVDTDPGYGLGTPITFAPNTNVVLTNLPITIPNTLGTGLHYFHIRSKQNPWSIDNVISFSVDAVVPITWSYIQAKLINAQTLVSWATEQEINTLKFELERSKDGIHFSKIGEKAAAGNSSTLRAYDFTDIKPEVGFNYYRIKQTDANGLFTYSAIVKVLNTKNIKEAFIAPNPVVDVVNLVEPIAININSLDVYDSKGTVVLRKIVNSTIQLYSLNVSALGKGNYVLKVNYGSHSKSIVFVK